MGASKQAVSYFAALINDHVISQEASVQGGFQAHGPGAKHRQPGWSVNCQMSGSLQ
jgi:hypothetical protein